MNSQIFCPLCHWVAKPQTIPIRCPRCDEQSLLKLRHYIPLIWEDNNTLSNYLPWIVGDRSCQTTVSIFRMKELEQWVGMDQVWILFSGFWPEQEGYLTSASFKELDAISLFEWIKIAYKNKVLLSSSAGNTGRALYHVALALGEPVIIVIPDNAVKEFWIPNQANGNITPFLISVRNGTYQDAINLANRLSIELSSEIVTSGGVHNIARRTALAFPYYYGVMKTKEVPKHYFQAVSSAAGAIGAYDVNSELIRMKYTHKRTAIHMVQNHPFNPIVDAWNSATHELKKLSPIKVKQFHDKIYAKVLSNTNPPYHNKGGIHEVLSSSGGAAYSVSNQEVKQAQQKWHKFATVSLDPAALVALAGLVKAVKSGAVQQHESVMLHLTGGGLEQSINANKLRQIVPNVSVEKIQVNHAIAEVRRYLSTIR